MKSSARSNSRLRIAHVVLQLDTGGMEKLLVEFGRHANAARFDLRFICLGGRGVLADAIEAHGWPVTILNEPQGQRPGMILELARLFEQWNLDVVHTHNTKPLLYAAPAARLARVPKVVHTCHGQRDGASLPHTMMFSLACRVVDRVVCVSNEIAERCISAGVPRNKLQTIWNGIDISAFSGKSPQIDGPAVVVARLRPEKDLETLLRATAIVVQQCPTFVLNVAGNGERAAALRQLANELNIASHVRFLGAVNDVPKLLSQARMFVSSSRNEGLSLSIMEAMASGLPVVATRVGGNAEIVLHEQTGLLVPAGNPQELAGAIVRIWKDPELGRQFGSAGQARVERHFDVRMMVDHYESLYEQLCQHRRETKPMLAGSMA